jgi:hypothetical protein
MVDFYRQEREHGVMGSVGRSMSLCRLKKERGGQGFRLRAAECCRDALARLRAADLQRGASEGGDGCCLVSTPWSGQSEQRDRGGWTQAACRAHGPAGSPPLDSIPAKFSYFAFARFFPKDVR